MSGIINHESKEKRYAEKVGFHKKGLFVIPAIFGKTGVRLRYVGDL